MRNRRIRALVAGLAAVALIAIGGWLITSGGGSSSSVPSQPTPNCSLPFPTPSGDAMQIIGEQERNKLAQVACDLHT